MPVDASKQPKRRAEKHFTHEELKVIQQKRLRGELSCAECRRLKLRCDKQVPCSTCLRRGCGSICPSGTLEAGAGTRFVMASTNQLHTKISIMSARIRALEDALAILQSTVSKERHPMLEEHLLKVKFTSDIPAASGEEHVVGEMTMENGTSNSSTSDSNADMSALDDFGSLTLGENGEITYFGRSAGNETLLVAQEDLLDFYNDAESDCNEKEDDGFMSMMTVHPRDGVGHPTDVTGRNTWYSEQLESTATSTSPQTTNQSSESIRLASADPLEQPSSVLPELFDLPLGEARSLYNSTELTVPYLVKHLPSYERAQALAQSYLDYGSVFFRPITKVELLDIILPRSYSFLTKSTGPNSVPVQTNHAADNPEEPVLNGPSPHALAGLFFIFALGSFFDLSLPAPSHETEAELWFQLGRRALVSRSGVAVSENPHPKTDVDSNTIGDAVPSHQQPSEAMHTASASFTVPPSAIDETIGALGLMANYISMAHKKYSRDSAWCILSMAAKLAQSAGLHLDPLRWGLDPTIVQRRRRLFWELFQADMGNSLALGRPPCTPLAFVDCQFPNDEESSLDDKGNVMKGLCQMKYQFAKDAYMPIANSILTVKLPSYTAVMDLDKQIRQIPIPSWFKPVVTIESEGEEVFHDGRQGLRDFFGSQHMNASLVYLHRSFFAHAILTHPADPLSSPFASSFLTAYRSSSEMIKSALNLYSRNPEIFSRVWFMTYHVFSAALVVGSVVRRCPSSTIAPSALMDLSMAVDLYAKHAHMSRRHQVAFFILKKLKTRAARLYADFLASKGLIGNAATVGQPEDASLSSKDSISEFEEGMQMFAGKTKVLTKKKKTKDSNRAQSDSGSAPSSVADTPSPQSDGGSGAHPSVSNTFPPLHTDGSTTIADYGRPNVDVPMDFNLGPDFNFDTELGFGMDSGVGIVMNMALEDINMENNSGGTQVAGTFGGFSHSDVPSSFMGYSGSNDMKAAPGAGHGAVDPFSSVFPQTASAQAAMLYGMGPNVAQMPFYAHVPFSTQHSNPGNIDAGTPRTGTTVSPPVAFTSSQTDNTQLQALFMEYLAHNQSPAIPSSASAFDNYAMSVNQGITGVPSMGHPDFSPSPMFSPTSQPIAANFAQQQHQKQPGCPWQLQGTSVDMQNLSALGTSAGTSLDGPDPTVSNYENLFKLMGLDQTQR